MLLGTLLGCLTPFSEDRHDLTDFRIVGLGATEDGELRALLWSGNGLWHATAPTVVWKVDGEVVTTVPSGAWMASAQASDADGNVETGNLEHQAGAANPTVGTLSRVVHGNTAELAFDMGEESVTHWMAPVGTFTESGPHEASWNGESGITPLIALHLDGKGGTSWSIFDVAIGDVGTTMDVGGRIFRVETELRGAGWYLVTLSASDDYAGFVLDDIEAAVGAADGESVCGADGLDFVAVAEGRCGRDALLGARVAIYGVISP